MDRIKELLSDGTLSGTAADFAEAQADEAARLRQMFLEVLDGMEVSAQGTVDSAQSGEKFSIKRSTEGFNYVEVDEGAIDLNDGRSVASVIAELIEKKFKHIITANKQEIRINSTTNREWRYSSYAKALYKASEFDYKNKIKSIANADELLTTAKEWINEERKHQSFDSFARGKVWYEVGNNGYSADIIVGLKNDGSATLYDLVEINEHKIKEASQGRATNRLPSRKDTSSESNIPQTGEDVNTSGESYSLPMAEQMDKLRLSLGLEAQNRNLLQQNAARAFLRGNRFSFVSLFPALLTTDDCRVCRRCGTIDFAQKRARFFIMYVIDTIPLLLYNI